jgi:hypothetical protein
VFGGKTEPRCEATVGDFQSLEFAPCGCDGYVPLDGPLAEAAFLAPDPDPLAGPPLRLA